jgi:hypothetical protein
MKAVIIEINKNYCIVMTVDGRFLRKKIKVGSAEIGDEITIESETFSAVESKKTWIRGFGIAFAVLAVIVAGATFSYRYFRQAAPMALSAPAVAEARTSAEEDKNQSMKMGAEAQSQEGVSAEASETAGVPLFEKIYTFEKDNILNEESLENLNLVFSFKVSGDNEKNLFVDLKNNDSKIFSGNLNFDMLDSNGRITRTITIEINGLGTGRNHEETIGISKEETGFQLRIYGSFN